MIFVTTASVFAVAALAGCGGDARRADIAPAHSKNYNAEGAWLGEVLYPGGTRECGYVSFGRHTASNIRVHSMTCAAAASAIDDYLVKRPPSRWQANFRKLRPPPGGPPGSTAVTGTLELRRLEETAVSAWLSTGTRTAPPPLEMWGAASEVHFGCHTRSSNASDCQ